MSSSQLPPPLGNFSFPPENVHFNYIDSFVTTWVTPDLSQGPCFLSLYYWNSSSPKEPWTSKFNQTVSLNGTKIVPLKMISSAGLGQLNLNYVDPVGSRVKITGTIFDVKHDPVQPKAMTWNLNALSSSSSLPSTAALSSATSNPTIAAATTTASSPSTIPDRQPIALPSPSTTPPAPATSSSSSASHGGVIASITLGTILGIVFVTALFIFWFRRRRQKKRKQAIHMSSTAPNPAHNQPHVVSEKDAGVASTELGSGDRRWELDTNRP